MSDADRDALSRAVEARVAMSGHSGSWCDSSNPSTTCERCLLRALLSESRAQGEEIKRLTTERDLAIAHDRQPYPTAHAYEQVCKARTKHQERADRAEQQLQEKDAEIARLKARVTELEQERDEARAKALEDAADAAYEQPTRHQFAKWLHTRAVAERSSRASTRPEGSSDV